MVTRPINNFIGTLTDGSEGTERQLREAAVRWAAGYCDDGIAEETINKIINGDSLSARETEYLKEQGLEYQLVLPKDKPKTDKDKNRVWALRITLPEEDGAGRKQWQDIALVRAPMAANEEGDEAERLFLQTTGYESSEGFEGEAINGALPPFISELIARGSPEIKESTGRQLLTAHPRIYSRPIDPRAKEQRRDSLVALAASVAFKSSLLPVVVFSLPTAINYQDGEGEVRTRLATELAKDLAGLARVVVLQKKPTVEDYREQVGHILAGSYFEGVTVHLPSTEKPLLSIHFGRNGDRDLDRAAELIKGAVYTHAVRANHPQGFFNFDSLAEPAARRGKLVLDPESSGLLQRALAAEERAREAEKARQELEKALKGANDLAYNREKGMQTLTARAASDAETIQLLRALLAESEGHRTDLTARVVSVLGEGTEEAAAILRPHSETAELRVGLNELAARNVLVIGEDPATRQEIELPSDNVENLEFAKVEAFLRSIDAGDGKTAFDNLVFTPDAQKAFDKSAKEKTARRSVAKIYTALAMLGSGLLHGKSHDEQKEYVKKFIESGADIDFTSDNETHIKIRDAEQSRIYFVRAPKRDNTSSAPRPFVITQGPQHE